MTMRTRRLALSSALLCLVVAGCSTDSKNPERDAGAAGSAPNSSTPAPNPVATPTAMPSRVPNSSGLVTNRAPTSVHRDADGRTTLCLGVQSLLPGAGCRGPELIGFEGNGGTAGLVRVVGRFDGKHLYVTDVLRPSTPGPAVADDVAARLRTPCPEPDGGWRITDPAKATGGAAGRAMKVARQQPGFAEFWYDRSFDSVPSVLNVAVAGDRGAAESALREVWGGALCVSEATYSQQALVRIASKVFKLPGVSTAAVRVDEVHVELLYDDGTLQAWADATYGAGLVRITSDLVPVA